MFQYAEADSNGLIDSGTITVMRPQPSEVSYPESFVVNPKVSRDGNPIIQLPAKDERERTWIWKDYRAKLAASPDSAFYARYETLFNNLLNLQYHVRLSKVPPESEFAYLYEDETGELDKLTLSAGDWVRTSDFVRVKILQVSRTTASRGGSVIYPQTILTFVIDDPNWNAF